MEPDRKTCRVSATARGEGDLNPRAQSALDPRGRPFVLSNPAPYQARRSPQPAPIKAQPINAFGATVRSPLEHMNEVPKSSWSRATAYTEGRRDAALLCMMSSRSRQAPIPELDPDTQSATWPRTLDRDGPFADMTLILVSNRLPVTVRRIGNRLDVQPNPGGVAAGLSSFHRGLQARWVRWPRPIAPGAYHPDTAPPPKRVEFAS